FQPGQLLSRSLEMTPVDSEDPKPLHVVDIEPQAITRKTMTPKGCVERQQIPRSGVAPARLMVSQRPKRRPWGAPHQTLQLARQLGQTRSHQKVDANGTLRCTDC